MNIMKSFMQSLSSALSVLVLVGFPSSVWAAPPTSEANAKAKVLREALIASGAQRAHVENCMISIFGVLENGKNEKGHWGYQWDFYLPDFMPLEESKVTTMSGSDLYFVELPAEGRILEKLDIIQTLMSHYFPEENSDDEWTLLNGAEGQSYLLKAEFKLEELLFGAKVSKKFIYTNFGRVTKFAAVNSIPTPNQAQAEDVLHAILDYANVARCEEFPG